MSIPGKDCGGLVADKFPVKEYENLVPQYNPVPWNARDVVRLAKETGQQYLLFVARRHDGFRMRDSKWIEGIPLGRRTLQELGVCAVDLGVARLVSTTAPLSAMSRGPHWSRVTAPET